jgi:hypothetical protein
MKDIFYDELERVFDKFPKYHMKILLGNFNAKVGREDFFKPTIGNESLHEISNANRGLNSKLCHIKISDCKCRMFPLRNIHKFTWISDGKTQNQIDHTLIDRRQYSILLDVRSFKAADCDTDHYLVWQRLGKDCSD